MQTQTQPALFRPVQSFFESSAPAGLLATNRRMAYFVAVADFVPAAGALFEVRLSHGDEVEVLEDEPAPNGWIHVRSASGDQGLVPLSFLAKSTASTGRSNPPSGQSPTVDDSKIARDSDGACSGDNAAGVGIATGGAETATPLSDAEQMEMPTVQEEEKKTLVEMSEEEIAAARAARQERLSWRVAIHGFKPEPGASFETAINVKDALEVVDVDFPLPAGWALVKHLHSDDTPGIVPEACLAPWPEEEDEKSFEEQKEEMELALQKAQSERSKVKEELAAKETALLEERKRADAAEMETKKALEALQDAGNAKQEMQSRLQEMDETLRVHEQLTEVLSEVPRIKSIVDTKLVERKGAMSDEQRVAQLKADVAKKLAEVEEMRTEGEELQKKATTEAKAERAGSREKLEAPAIAPAAPTAESRRLPPGPPTKTSDEISLITADKERAALAEKIKRLEEERVEAVREMKKAEDKYLIAAKHLNAEDEAVLARDRIITLLPKVKELLAPTQDELMVHLESMAGTIMRQAEDSAKVLLETLARTNDPQRLCVADSSISSPVVVPRWNGQQRQS